MNATLIALIAFAGILATTLLGMRLRVALPDHHLSADTKETVRVGMGLVATMTALLLGLLIATAKGSYDTQRTQVIQVAAKVGFVERIFSMYGEETVESRRLLRSSAEELVKILWRDKASPDAETDPAAIASARALYSSIQRLTPQTDEQRTIKSEALSALTDLSKTRWLLVAQSDTSIPTPLLVMVIVWLAIIFLSFGLFAPTNKTVIAIMVIVALLVSSALFVILELDRPFDGVIQVSSAPLQNVLSHFPQ